MPRKAKKKKGGWPIRQPKRPAPPPSSSEEDDEEMVLIRGLINRMEVLKKAKAVPSDKGAGPSGVVVPTKVPCHTCGTARTQLVKSLSNRMEVPEKGGGPAGPVSPTEPVDPGMLMPGGPVPVLPSPGVPLPPLPVDPVPVLPSSVVPLPPLPVDQSALNSAVPLAPGAGGAAAPVRVLVCGHSLVFWAFKRTSTSQWGTQLGFGKRALVYWLGMRGILWGQLLPAIQDHLAKFPEPDIIVIHLGENDLGRRTGLSLVQQASSDLAILQGWIPGIRILWVNWLQRRVWQGVQNVLGIEKARCKSSTAIGKLVRAAGGEVLRQPGLSARFPELFHPDGVHLSEVGCDLYLSNIRKRLAEFVERYGAGRSS
ncbi:uncharacterized protein LOC128342232 isoform X1 [Hemicordylus capensis]|uniref:uncharacterized protein LOC128342232 isoform X1 n=1 Tax=Hemicordylus capensis TaxID=884348 RepID=UPI0023026918|nr:uncharacterized protein LOC128342232 isoform X1 [Hemicordylus capensis]